jgi:type I restriction enzyme M protein
MPKSLGDKRKELTLGAIEEITKLYSNAISVSSDARVKVMKNEEFGYARLTIERPLRRIWRVDENVISASPSVLRSKLEKLAGQTFSNQAEAEKAVLSVGFEGKEVKIVIKMIATTDVKAPPVPGKKHSFEPDSELRDNENIALPTNFIQMSDSKRSEIIEKQADEYLIREIHPYMADAWIDHGKTKIGYEIPFTRNFYTYTAPRPVAVIRSEIETLAQEINELMKELR